jgi:hypothetical protein
VAKPKHIKSHNKQTLFTNNGKTKEFNIFETRNKFMSFAIDEDDDDETELIWLQEQRRNAISRQQDAGVSR